MDDREMPPCSSCGSRLFEEVDGLYYCLVCSTQVAGLTVEVRQYESGFAYLRSIKQGPAKTRKKKTLDTGEPWTTIEAFNIILVHQCSQLEEKLKLGPQFRVILFSLWAEYLAKCEAAFTGIDQEKPKVNITSHLRDVQLIGQDLEKVTVPLTAPYKPKQNYWSGATRIKRNVTRRITDAYFYRMEDSDNSDASEKEDDDDDDDGYDVSGPDVDDDDYDENIDNENIEEERKAELFNNDLDENDNLLANANAKDQSMRLNDVPAVNSWTDIFGKNPDLLLNDPSAPSGESKLCQLMNDTKFPDDRSEDLSTVLNTESSKTIQNEASSLDCSEGLRFKGPRRWKAKHKVKKKLIRQVLQKFDSGYDFDDLCAQINQKNIKDVTAEASSDEEDTVKVIDPRLKQPELTKRSRLIKMMIDENMDSGLLRNTDDITVERMTIHKTLHFILLAFRIAGYNIHASDLIHWILMGHLTFFDAHKILPEEWLLLPGGDLNVLKPRRIVHVEALERNTITLKNFLSIPCLPHPDFTEMIFRHIFELNLPLQLVDIITQRIGYREISRVQRAFRVDESSKIIPSYDVYSICSIIVILKKLFALDGSSEFKISQFIRKNWPRSFIWEDWLNNTNLCWKLINQHYFPVNSSLDPNMPDIEVIRCHRDKLSNHWFGIRSSMRSKLYYLTQDFRYKLAESIEESFDVDKCAMQFPPFTVYHFYEAKRFVAKRLNDIQRSSSSTYQPIFDENFTNQSIDYLFDKSYKFIDTPSEMFKKPKDMKWEQAFEKWPESIRLLVNIGCFITNRSPKIIIPMIKRLDSYVNL